MNQTVTTRDRRRRGEGERDGDDIRGIVVNMKAPAVGGDSCQCAMQSYGFGRLSGLSDRES